MSAPVKELVKEYFSEAEQATVLALLESRRAFMKDEDVIRASQGRLYQLRIILKQGQRDYECFLWKNPPRLPPHGSLAGLQIIIGFTDSDLAKNRGGLISLTQMNRLLKRIQLRTAEFYERMHQRRRGLIISGVVLTAETAGLLGIMTLVALSGLVISACGATLLVITAIIIALSLTVIAGSMPRRWRELKATQESYQTYRTRQTHVEQGVIAAVRGEVRKHQTPKSQSKYVQRIMQVGDVTFSDMPLEIYEEFIEDRPYAVYYIPGMLKIVSAEPLSSDDT